MRVRSFSAVTRLLREALKEVSLAVQPNTVKLSRFSLCTKRPQSPRNLHPHDLPVSVHARNTAAALLATYTSSNLFVQAAQSHVAALIMQ
jgi:hypothetical protein